MREQYFGTNRKKLSRKISYLEILWKSLDDFTLKVLMAAAVISIVVKMITENEHRDRAWIEGFMIFIAVMVSSNV